MLENGSVCLLNDSFPPLIDGVENAVVNYAKCMTQKGINAVVATPSYPGADDTGFDFPVVRYSSLNTTKQFGYRLGYPFSKKAVNRIKSSNPLLLHTHCPFASTFLARMVQQEVEAPIVFTYHTKFDIEINKAVEMNFLRKTAKKFLVNNISACDEVWVVSKGAGENLKGLGYEGDYVVMENGVDLKKGLASPETVAELRQKHGLSADIPTFLFVGRLMWYKGARIILDGLRALANEGEDFRMVFVGDSNEREEIEEYAKELGIYEKCVFTGSIRNREIIRGYFTLSDLFLFPSSFDTNGIVVREAAACGKASVLLAGSCAAEGIEDGKTGLLIEENGQSMAKCLSFACKNRDKLETLGKTAMDEIYISWDDAVDKATHRYELVVERFNSQESRRQKVRFDEMCRAFSEINVAMQRVEDTSRFVFQKLVKKSRKPNDFGEE